MLTDEPGEVEQAENSDVLAPPASRWRAWLPAANQLRSALKMNLDSAIDGDPSMREVLAEMPDIPPATTMRQGLGLVFIAALVAGLLPTIFELTSALQADTSVMFAQMAQRAGSTSQDVRDLFAPLSAWMETVEVVAGLEPIAPGWLAASLSALGSWLNWPLNWLSTWIVYGLGVLVFAKFLGAPTTLQRFYAGISYACLPLILLGLSPIPYVGWLMAMVGLIWAIVVLVQAVRVVAGFDALRASVCVISPVLIGLLVALAVAGATAVSVFRLFV